MQPEMNWVLRLLVVALVVAAGVVGLALCADGPCASCADACCGGADRARSLARLSRTIIGICAPTSPSTLLSSATTVAGGASAFGSSTLSPVLPGISALRI